MYPSLLVAATVGSAFAIAFAALVAFALFDRQRRDTLRRIARRERDRVVFLFDGPHLADATTEARHVLRVAPQGRNDWARLRALLARRFTEIGRIETALVEDGDITLVSEDRTTRLAASWRAGLARIELIEDQSEPAGTLDRHALAAMEEELAILRSVTGSLPYPTWRENRAGEITWANPAYLDIAEAADPSTAVQPWPPFRLFGDDTPAGPSGARRAALSLSDDPTPSWFTLFRAETRAETQFTAVPADEAVRAEKALSEFISTLTKTFADLPIGLAIFDRDRRLSLFNPALTDLTMLPAEFLCGQPSLFDFLDRLRDRRMIPEPKDYKSWRHRMSELEREAVNGSYLETWHLPTGQTYRVTGRPHPDGAVAFLLEDVTAEVSLNRRFRAELEMGQAALDAMPDAVAIFSSAGVLTMTNHAYAALWGGDPLTGLDDLTVADATASWHTRCAPTPVWRQLRSFVHEPGDRQSWTAPVSLRDGRVLSCRFVPIAGGATMAAFAMPASAPRPVPACEPQLAANES